MIQQSFVPIQQQEPQPQVQASKKSALNMNFFLNNKETIIAATDPIIIDAPEKKRKKRTPSADSIVKADDERQLQPHESNVPYIETYAETNGIIKSAVYDLGVMQKEIQEDIAMIRASKTLKKKYDYLTNLTVARGSIISSQINGAKELNKIITDSHNLDMKRVKELKMTENAKDDDKYIMDMYNAFIATPVGNRPQGLSPSIMDLNMLTDNMVRSEIGTGAVPNVAGMLNGGNQGPAMSATQNMMRLEANPNVKTVVMYDGATGNRWFDVIDTTTGQSMPNSETPDAMFLSDINLDFRNGIARDTNLDRTYPLISVNNNILSEY